MSQIKPKVKLLRALRIKELSLMTGFSFVAILFIDLRKLISVGLNLTVLVYVFGYVFAVYFLNSYSDYKEDSLSERLADVGFISRTRYLKLFLVFTMFFFACALGINTQVLLFSLIGLFLWMMYYLPPLRLKATLGWGTLVHLCAGVAHFSAVFLAYDQFSLDTLVIATYFGILLAVGHFHHQIIDYEVDSLGGVKTTTVRIGVFRTKQIRTFVALLALAYWVAIYILGFLKMQVFIPFLLASLLLILASVRYKKLNQAVTYQRIVRITFFTMGIAAAIGKAISELSLSWQ